MTDVYYTTDLSSIAVTERASGTQHRRMFHDIDEPRRFTKMMDGQAVINSELVIFIFLFIFLRRGTCFVEFKLIT